MVILLAILIVLVCVLLHYYYKYVHVFNKRLKRFASPPALPIVGHALDFATKANLDVLTDYTKNYGPIVKIKIGPKRTLLLISDFKFIEFVLCNNKIIEKSIDYRNLSRWLGTGLLTGGGEKWKHQRRLISSAFHDKILKISMDVFERNAKILVEKLEQHQGTSSVNIYPFITLCTLDVICESAMGKSIRAQENAHSDYVRSVKEMCRIIVERAFSPHKMFDFIYRFTDDYQIEQAALKILHEHTKSVIVAKQNEVRNSTAAANKDNKQALLDLMLSLNFTNDDIRQQVDTFMFAGHDTTASALSFTLFCLANHPDVQERVLEEQQEIFGEDFLRPSTKDNLRSMKYLEMVIKESLRLYPPVPFIGREVTEDVIYDGEHLPKGLTLTLFIYALHRNPDIYPEPEKFIPDRFDHNREHDSIPFAYIPFSAGSRNCIGSRFAMAEMKTILSRLIRHFELRPSIPQHHLQLASETVLISKNGICISYKKRS